MPKLKSIAELIANAPEGLLPPSIDLQGWNSDHPIFDRLIAETQPKNIVEVGTWKGRSAMHMALASESIMGIDDVSGAEIPARPNIYCVDTWLGGFDHILSDKPHDAIARDAVGSPQLFHQFLRNFAEEPRFAKRVFPIQNTSINGARWLASLRIAPELIYIDGSHEYEDVYADLLAYSQILAGGGVMFGDDFRAFPGVFAAVIRFHHEAHMKLEEVAGNFWILRTP